mmetsp:Transcript_3464/g.13954  ORF Transcript_3464/g.13954 Transcript_3464/m.13954 type:complete len:265 (-) Transcript_3464:38-832(-)
MHLRGRPRVLRLLASPPLGSLRLLLLGGSLVSLLGGGLLLGLETHGLEALALALHPARGHAHLPERLRVELVGHELRRVRELGLAQAGEHHRVGSRLPLGVPVRGGDARGGGARERGRRAEAVGLSHRPQTRVPRAERSHRGAQRENRQHPHGLHHRTGGERPRERAEHAARARASSGVRRLAGIARGGNAEPRVVEAVEGCRRRGAVPRVSLLRAPRQDGRGRVRSRVHLPTRQSTSEGTVPTAVPEPKPPDDRPRPPDFPET